MNLSLIMNLLIHLDYDLMRIQKVNYRKRNHTVIIHDKVFLDWVSFRKILVKKYVIENIKCQ